MPLPPMSLSENRRQTVLGGKEGADGLIVNNCNYANPKLKKTFRPGPIKTFHSFQNGLNCSDMSYLTAIWLN